MKKEVYGCSCCSPEFGKIFRSNRKVAALAARPLRSIMAGRGWSDMMADIGRRAFLKGGLASAGAAGLWPAGARAQDGATTVFTGGTVLTVDADFSEAGAIAIRGNRILAVGGDAEVRAAAGEGAKILDLEGKTVLPGFVDAHTHVVSGAVIDSTMDYVGMARFATTAEVLDHLGAIAARTPAGEWIAARNYDPAVQDGPDALTFAKLDAVSTRHPIFVLNASGHLAYANSKAFEAAGIPDDVENPQGAEFVRDETGKLNGVMKNIIAFLQVIGKYPLWPMPTRSRP